MRRSPWTRQTSPGEMLATMAKKMAIIAHVDVDDVEDAAAIGMKLVPNPKKRFQVTMRHQSRLGSPMASTTRTGSGHANAVAVAVVAMSRMMLVPMRLVPMSALVTSARKRTSKTTGTSTLMARKSRRIRVRDEANVHVKMSEVMMSVPVTATGDADVSSSHPGQKQLVTWLIAISRRDPRTMAGAGVVAVVAVGEVAVVVAEDAGARAIAADWGVPSDALAPRACEPPTGSPSSAHSFALSG